MNKISKTLLLFLICSLALFQPLSATTFELGNRTFLLNGKPFVIRAAEIHYPRIPKEYWEHRIQMCKAMGMNTICLYVFWNIHEQKMNEFDFKGQNDIREFCELAQKNGMYIIVRPGSLHRQRIPLSATSSERGPGHHQRLPHLSENTTFPYE